MLEASRNDVLEHLFRIRFRSCHILLVTVGEDDSIEIVDALRYAADLSRVVEGKERDFAVSGQH